MRDHHLGVFVLRRGPVFLFDPLSESFNLHILPLSQVRRQIFSFLPLHRSRGEEACHG